MRKRKWLSLLAIVLTLACLAGCGNLESQTSPDPLAAYDGTWYMAQSGVACQFGEGKIYRDDLESREGQTLSGVYREVDGRVEANLTGVGGVDTPRPLYIVETDAGQALCDSADGTGTIYFYRDAVAVLALLEEREAAAETAAASRGLPDLTLPDDTQEPDGSSPADVAALEDGTSEPGGGETITRGSGVWIPKSGSKYHSIATCSGMKDPTQVTKEEAERRGYTPCKRCH